MHLFEHLHSGTPNGLSGIVVRRFCRRVRRPISEAAVPAVRFPSDDATGARTLDRSWSIILTRSNRVRKDETYGRLRVPPRNPEWFFRAKGFAWNRPHSFKHETSTCFRLWAKSNLILMSLIRITLASVCGNAFLSERIGPKVKAFYWSQKLYLDGT